MFKKYIVITIDIWHKIICKTSSQNKNKIIDICLNSWKLKIIMLLLQIQNTRYSLHVYSSIVEILRK
jgi:hypothetical protein